MPPSRSESNPLFRQQCYVHGQWVDAGDGKRVPVDNPADGKIIGTVPSLGRGDIEAAIASGATGFASWRTRTAQERADQLLRWHRLIEDNRDHIASLMTLEQGKPLAEAKGEVDYAASFIRWFAEEARRIYGETIPGAKPGQHIVVIRQPVGVTAAITPWNFPAAMIARKAGAALAAGCSMIVKPATATPYTALALAQLAHDAGIPPG